MTEPKPTYKVKECVEGGAGDCRNRDMIADLMEDAKGLQLVIDAQCQTIEAMQERIEQLQAENQSLRDMADVLDKTNRRQSRQIVDLESTVREYQE